MLTATLAKLAVVPTIYYGSMLELIGLRQWYTRIDDHCLLGALPMKRNYLQIVRDENIKAVLTMNQDHELVHSISKAEWQSIGVEQMQIAVEDYVGVADTSQLEKAVSFIEHHKSRNQCVYVHCKAGRYRSALVVACYLIKDRGMRPEQAVELLKQIRPCVILEKKRQFDAMNMFYNRVFPTQK